MDLATLKRDIDRAAQSYYRADSDPIMSDAEYDQLIAKLRSVAPDDFRLTRVGVPYDPEEMRSKIKHPIPMGSLDNTDDGIAGFAKWHGDVANQSVCASLKVDGSSIRLRYRDGELVEAATRGNGEVGELITANVINFKNVPTSLPKPLNIDVRGEAILFVEEYRQIRAAACGCPFEQIAEKDRSNPRNIGNGIIGRDDGTDSDKMRFLAFNVEAESIEFKSEIEKLTFVAEMGFDVVPHKLCQTAVELFEYHDQINTRRGELDFEIDGLVVCVNSISVQNQHVTQDIKSRLRPKYARAIKFAHKANTTKVLGVDVSIGHTGAIVPTAVLKEVRIGGVNVVHALLNNWDEIDRLDVCIGDEVEVVLAGDIIPKITKVVNKAKDRQPINEPDICPVCDSKTTRLIRGKRGAVTYCVSKQCPGAALQKISKWIGGSKTGVGILGIGDAILQLLWDNRIVRDPSDLYRITPDMIKDMEIMAEGRGIRIGLSRAQEIVNNIQSKKSLTLDVFLGSLGIELLGKRRVKILQQAAPGRCSDAGGELDRLEDWLDDIKLANIQLEGFGDTIRESVRIGIDENRDLINKLLEVGVTIDYPNGGEKMPDNQFSGVSFCFTGTRECLDQVTALGAEIKSGVSKSSPSPDFLVQKDPLSTSTKTKNAESNGHTRIISIDFLRKCLAGEANLR